MVLSLSVHRNPIASHIGNKQEKSILEANREASGSYIYEASAHSIHFVVSAENCKHVPTASETNLQSCEIHLSIYTKRPSRINSNLRQILPV